MDGRDDGTGCVSSQSFLLLLLELEVWMSGLIRTRGGWPSLLLLKGDGLDDASRRLPSVSSFKPPAVTVVSKSSTGAGG